MTNQEIIFYLNQTLQLNLEMQPLARKAVSHSTTNCMQLSELETKMIKSKVYLQESIMQLEERFAITYFLKHASVFTGYILFGILIGFLLAHK